MADIQIFDSPEFGSVRMLDENGKILFCASDVAKALGYTNAPDAVNRHCRAIVKRDTPISGKIQEINFIPEGDVYRLITHSKLPGAEKFESWVFDDVLPTLRKTGSYMMPKMTKELQAIFLLDNRTAQLDQRVTALENNAVIDYGQQRTLTSTVNRRVIVDTLGGKGSPACDNPHVRGVVYCEINKDLQNWFRVNARNNIPKKRFDEAIEYVNRWKPSTNTAMLIQQTNGQTSLYDAYENGIRG